MGVGSIFYSQNVPTLSGKYLYRDTAEIRLLSKNKNENVIIKSSGNSKLYLIEGINLHLCCGRPDVQFLKIGEAETDFNIKELS